MASPGVGGARLGARMSITGRLRLLACESGAIFVRAYGTKYARAMVEGKVKGKQREERRERERSGPGGAEGEDEE